MSDLQEYATVSLQNTTARRWLVYQTYKMLGLRPACAYYLGTD